MRRRWWKSVFTKPAGPARVLLVALLTSAAVAQVTPATQSQRVLAPAYDPAHEITVTGTVQKVATRRVAGSVPGVHLLLAGSQGVIDTHIGSISDPSLQAGTLVEVVGVIATVHGQPLLLARQLVFNGKTVTVRNQHGFLVYPVPARPRTVNGEKSDSRTFHGGAQ